MKNRLYMVAMAAVFLVPHSLRAQGFGVFTRRIVTINRVLPPTVNLEGKRIGIEVTTDGVPNGGEQLRSMLQMKLATLIQKEPHFILQDTAPEIILKFSITNFDTEASTVHSGKRQASTAYRGKIEVANQAIDVPTKTALDSENLVQTAGYDRTGSDLASMNMKSLKAAESSVSEVRDELVDGIVRSVAQRIAPTAQPFNAPLPGGKLEPLSSLALSGRWGALEEQAEKMNKFPRPEDDTYRLYLIAIAKEAQAYGLTGDSNERALGKRTDISPKQAEEDFQRAQRYLDEARAIYKGIITANPAEREFRSGDARTEEALAVFERIGRYREENARAHVADDIRYAEAGSAESGGRSSAAIESSSGEITSPLDHVLAFCNLGINADSIKEYIASADFLDDARASGYKFNFAKDPIRLNDACKANAGIFQRLMRGRLVSAPEGQSDKPHPRPPDPPGPEGGTLGVQTIPPNQN